MELTCNYRVMTALAILALPAGALAAEAPTLTDAPKAVRQGDTVRIAFAVDRPTDVEVAVLDAKGKMVRHLAAGVLGGKHAPPPPLKPGLKQTLTWDGKDDLGEAAKGAPFTVRVRAGMGVELERIVGGDPYAFYSKQMGQGDHAGWEMTGLEAKSDGTVYLLGNANVYGPPALRAYDAGGNYLRTVYPPPAGKPLDQMKGWGIYQRADGTYSFQYNDLSSPALSRTSIAHYRADIGSLIPSAGNDTLLIRGGPRNRHRLMRVNTDGSLPPDFWVEGDLVNEPAMRHPENNVWRIPWRLFGPIYTCLAPDGEHFYLSGVFAGTLVRTRYTGAKESGFWRDGQVFKVDLASRKASVFFAMDEDQVIVSGKDRGQSPIADTRYSPCAAFQGVAVDKEERVFVCDRQHERIVVLDKAAKTIREIPVAYPEAVALSPRTRALYVTTRYCNAFHKPGKLQLLKFNDWSRDTEPSVSLSLCDARLTKRYSMLTVAESKGSVYVWVAYTTLPVRVYRETDAGLELAKDFYEAGPQRALDLQHMMVDQKTGDAYIADGFGLLTRITDWRVPHFERCVTREKKPLGAVSVAIDSRNRYLYTHRGMGPVHRYSMVDGFFTPAPAAEGGNAVTPPIIGDWRIRLGRGDRGLAAAPDGSLAVLGTIAGQKEKRGAGYTGFLHYFRAQPDKTPWKPIFFRKFGPGRAGGIRFDSRGNLYVGNYDGKPEKPPKGFETDRNFAISTGRIYKFAPTGSIKTGNLFPTEPAAPAKVYDVHYGSIGPVFSRTPRFGVDGYGRIYYPTSLLPQVSVIDNGGNGVLRFGTYGNRDSLGGLEGDLVPTKDIPMAWPNSVDATDDYIYVSDIVNIRLLRIAKTFAATETAEIK